ncbi:tail protein X [Rhodomicrobium lacus]|uniref:tail protein X n=1 Tax=Rhodomicrobium lacus TaxID=2498452 RepID=UPI000F8F50F1|nr:tail protein X [Rhodomicrobium lacus]
MTETVTIRGEGITLDLLLWRKYGRTRPNLVEAALLLNPGLAALGAELPLGTVVTLPDEPEATTTTETAISLWD